MIDGLSEEQKRTDTMVKAQLPLVVKLPEPSRSRCLLALSYEYFVQDMEEEAFVLLSMSDSGYYDLQFAVDIVERDDMRELLVIIVQKLIEGGYVSKEILKKKE